MKCDDEPFVLRNDPPRPKPEQFENVSARQTMLLAGLECDPDQQDLFPTDGETNE